MQNSEPRNQLFFLLNILEFVNNILTTEYLTFLFDNKDKEGIISTVWPKAEAVLPAVSGVSATVTKKTACDCAAHLHKTLRMSPAGPIGDFKIFFP